MAAAAPAYLRIARRSVLAIRTGLVAPQGPAYPRSMQSVELTKRRTVDYGRIASCTCRMP